VPELVELLSILSLRFQHKHFGRKRFIGKPFNSLAEIRVPVTAVAEAMNVLAAFNSLAEIPSLWQGAEVQVQTLLSILSLRFGQEGLRHIHRRAADRFQFSR